MVGVLIQILPTTYKGGPGPTDCVSSWLQAPEPLSPTGAPEGPEGE